MAGPITGPGVASIAAANAKAKAAAAAVKAAKAAAAKQGIVKSPIPALTPPGTKSVQVGTGAQIVNTAGIRNFLISKGYDLTKTNDPNVGVALAAAMNNYGLHNIPTKFAPTSALVTMMQDKGWKADGYSGSKSPAAFNSGSGVSSKVGSGAAANFTTGGNVKFNPTSSYDPTSMNTAANATGSIPINESLASRGAKLFDAPTDGTPISELLANNGAKLLNAPTAQAPIDESLANGGAKLLDANALSQALASNEWDNTINDATNAEGKNTAQGAQNLHDIGAWYDQALGSLSTAAGRDTAITKAGQDSVTAADQAIIGSLGGSASAGASTVGAQAASDQGTLAALGASQDQYNQDIAPIMQGERAGQLSAETARGSQRAADLAQALAAAKTSKAGSTAQHLMDITNTNNSIRDNQIQRLLSIKQSNQALVQQNFADAQSVDAANNATKDNQIARLLSIKQSNQALAQQDFSNSQSVAGANNSILDNRTALLLQIKQANDAKAQQNFANSQSIAGTNIAALAAGARVVAAQNKPTKGSFGDTTAYVKANMAAQVYGDLKNAKTPQQAQQLIAAHIAGAGWSMKDPGVASYASSLYNNWQPPTG